MKFLKAKIKLASDITSYLEAYGNKFVVIYKNDTVEYLNKEELSKKIMKDDKDEIKFVFDYKERILIDKEVEVYRGKASTDYYDC